MPAHRAVDLEQLRLMFPLQGVLVVLQVADSRRHFAAPSAGQPALHRKYQVDTGRLSAVENAAMGVPDLKSDDLLAERRALQKPAQARHMLCRERIALSQFLKIRGDEAVHV